MGEAYILWQGTSGSDFGCSQVFQDGDWLGDMAADDYPLGVSSYCERTNFETDDWKKTDSRLYVCCLNIH